MRTLGSQTEARARECKTPADRVDFIADLMAELNWTRGKTGKLLAPVWGVSESAVKNYSAEASRRVVGDADDARRDITAACSKLLKQAVKEGNAKDARAVGELWAQVSGAKAPEKHQVGPLEATPEFAAAAVREAFGSHGSVGSEEEVPPANDAGEAEVSAVPEAPSES